MFDYYVFILYCIITIIIQCFALRKAIVTKDERFLSSIGSIFLGMILSSISGAFLINSFDGDCSCFGDWGAFLYLFASGIMIIIGLIVMIIGLIIKLKLKKNRKIILVTSSKSSKVKILFITNVIMISLLLLTLVIPYQIKLQNFRNLEINCKEYLDNYLDNEYGKDNYEIIYFERDYSYNGIISKSFIGFEAIIQLDNMEDYFSVYVHGTNNNFSISDEITQRKSLGLSPLN